MRNPERGSAEWLSEDETPDWLKKCLTCKYCYKKRTDDETIYCRKIKCEYKKYESKKSIGGIK